MQVKEDKHLLCNLDQAVAASTIPWHAFGAEAANGIEAARWTINQNRDWRVGDMYDVIPGKLAFCVCASKKDAGVSQDRFPDRYFVNAGFESLYKGLNSDFGPVNLGVLHAFCKFMSKMREYASSCRKELVYYSSDDMALRTNCAFLLAAYLVVECGYTAVQAWEPFRNIRGRAFATFRDASDSPQDYDLTIPACLQGLLRAMSLGWYSPKTFDLDHYAHHDNPLNGDMHMVTPKFAAFKGPVSECGNQLPAHMRAITFAPEHFIATFKSKGITAVVRLNESSTYSPAAITASGLRHYDLFFDDCSVPDHNTVSTFFEIAKKEPCIAVHCRAGLGRTGTLIAAYMMKYNKFSAAESIGWLRIVRPGSVIGCQQQYLHYLERVFGGESSSALMYEMPRMSPDECALMGAKIALAQENRARKRKAEQIECQWFEPALGRRQMLHLC